MPTATPDTFNFMVAGYAAFWVVLFLFVGSLWVRTRNLEKSIEVLRQVAEVEGHDED